MFLTICYTTSRINPRIEWFYKSLLRQVKPEDKIKLVIVDRNDPMRHGDLFLDAPFEVLTTKPKPCVWQGENKLTKVDWFAAANARNTGLCLAQDGFIAYSDDLSVLFPSWLQSVREAMAGNYLVCGAYQKVKKLVVEDGEIKSFDGFSGGIDNRTRETNQQITPCSGRWLYGCSCAMPVESLLNINGWDENCDGCGSEDYCTGIRLTNAGYGFRYDKRMMTCESEEAHSEEPAMRRTDKGQSPYDKSHALLRMAEQSKWSANYFGEIGIRGLRERILTGENFPVMGVPDRCFFDGQKICNMI